MSEDTSERLHIPKFTQPQSYLNGDVENCTQTSGSEASALSHSIYVHSDTWHLKISRLCVCVALRQNDITGK